MGVPMLSTIIESYNHSKYETTPLEEALKMTFGDTQFLFGGQREDNERVDVNVAVTATSLAGSGVLLSNYNRLCLEKRKHPNSHAESSLKSLLVPYIFQRPEKPIAELRTWEA